SGLYGVIAVIGGSAEAGLGYGAAGQAQAGGGVFFGGPNGTNLGSFAGGGGIVGGPSGGVGTSPGGGAVIGASAGWGFALGGTNAECVEELGGGFTTANVTFEGLNGSISWSTSDLTGRLIISFTVGAGLGSSASLYPTTTPSPKTGLGKSCPNGNHLPDSEGNPPQK